MLSLPWQRSAQTCHRRRRPVPRARQAVLWGTAWLVLGHLAVIGFLEWKQPEFFDPHYGCRLVQLRLRLAQSPGLPLAIILGSSRAEQGLRPHLLAGSTDRAAPILFNMARGGSSPLLHLLTLERLLADGIRPDCLLVEVFPPSLVEEDEGVTIPQTTLRDYPLLKCFPLSWHTHARYLRDRLLLLHRQRGSFLARLAPNWLLWPEPWKTQWDPWSGEWRHISAGASAQERRRLTADAHRRYFHKLQSFRVSACSDRALHGLLDLCRTQHIRVVLFLMPEAAEFRSWYPPAAQEKLTAFLGRLRKQYEAPLIDARGWVADQHFWDSHHLLHQGALLLTERFVSVLVKMEK